MSFTKVIHKKYLFMIRGIVYLKNNKGRIAYAGKSNQTISIMKKLGGLDWVALVLTIVGGLNWGLVSLLNWNLVDTIFGAMSGASQIVYGLVGLSALYILVIAGKLSKK